MLPEAWSIKTKAPVSCLTLTEGSGWLVAAVGFKNPTISCWSLDTRRLLWDLKIPKGFVGSRSVDYTGYGNHVLVSNSNGIVYATCGGKIGNAWSNLLFFSTGGDIRKKHFLKEKVLNIGIIEHKVFVLTRDAYLNVFDLEGNSLWSFFLPRSPDTPYEYAFLLGPRENRLGFVRGSKYLAFDPDGNILCEWTFPFSKKLVGYTFDEKETAEEFVMVRQIFMAGDLLPGGGTLLQSKDGNFFQLNPKGECSEMGEGPRAQSLMVLKDKQYCFSNGINLFFAEGAQVLKSHKLKPAVHSSVYASSPDLLFTWGGYDPLGSHITAFRSSGEIVWSAERLEHLRCGAVENNGLILAIGNRIAFLPYLEFNR